MQNAEEAVPNPKSNTSYFLSAPEPLNLAARSYGFVFRLRPGACKSKYLSYLVVVHSLARH